MLKLVAALVLTASLPAFGYTVESCEERGVDLTSIIQPVAKNAKTFYNNDVAVYGIDQIEPACCSYGVAVVMPDPQAELGGSKKCLVIMGLGGVNVGLTQAVYDPSRGLSLVIPASSYDPDKGSIPGEPLKLLLNVKKGSVTLQ